MDKNWLFYDYLILRSCLENIVINPIYILISYQLMTQKPTMNIEIIDKGWLIA